MNTLNCGQKGKSFILFDFDGTITRKDTFTLFLKFCRGRLFYYQHLPLLLVIVILMKAGILTAKRAKEIIYHAFFKNYNRSRLTDLGAKFAEYLISHQGKYLYADALKLISEKKNEKSIIIISASPELYIKPFAALLGIEGIGTKFCFDEDDAFTGKLVNNCNKEEKLNSLKEEIGTFDGCEFEVYGDSTADAQMMSLADSSCIHYKYFNERNLVFKAKLYLNLLRVHQYLKNLFIFIPLFFAGELFNFSLVITLIQAFAAFSFCCSAVYIFNDINDAAQDRNHQLKRFRPIAANLVSVKEAAVLGTLIFLLGILLAFYCSYVSLILIAVYLCLNLAYTLFLKKFALIDLVCIALGFNLRVFLGAELIHLQLSSWLVLMVFLLSMFLAAGKRWDDLSRSKSAGGKNIRASLYGYNREFALSTLTFLSAVNTICYIQWTMDIGTITRIGSSFLYLTAFWVIIGNLRYLQDIFVLNKGYSPTKVLIGDPVVLLSVISWLIHVMLILYIK